MLLSYNITCKWWPRHRGLGEECTTCTFFRRRRSRVRNCPSPLHFFVNVPRANSSEEMRFEWGTGDPSLARRKAGAKAGAATIRFEEWLREVVRFVSKTIKWLTPSKERHGEKIITCSRLKNNNNNNSGSNNNNKTIKHVTCKKCVIREI